MTTTAATEAPFWQEPSERSPAAARILELIERGAWKPAESTLWRDPRDAAKRAQVHEWEWRNLILHGHCARLADTPACPWPVQRLPHCPTQVFEPYQDRDGTRYLQGLCVCPEPDAEQWPRGWDRRVHWVARHYDTGEHQYVDVPLYCHCGGPEDPPGSGIRWAGGDGFVCEPCSAQLVTTPYTRSWRSDPRPGTGHIGDGPCWSHRLKCDCRCCYCGDLASAGRGWRLMCHPPIGGVAGSAAAA